MTIKVRFKNAHPGYGGAVVSLPRSVKSYIDFWDGDSGEVNDFILGIGKLNPEAQVAIDWKFKYISMKIKMQDGVIHCWKLVEFDV